MLPIHRTRVLRACVAAAAIAAANATQAAPASAEETLDNGLRVLYIRHAANPMIASSVVVSAGVIHEPAGQNGASHFLEHLLFNGTERRSQRELYDEVDRFGAYNNATTREDHTLFSLLIQKEFAEQGLDIQADMLFHSTLPTDKFEKEKGIVLEELAKDEADPAYRAAGAFRAFAYAGTPLAQSVLGTEESIRGLTRDSVLDYYKKRYVPGNMFLVVMGDFEIPEMKQVVRRTFGKAPKGIRSKAAGGSWPAPPAKNFSIGPLDTPRQYVSASIPLPIAPWESDFAAVELLVAAIAQGDDAPLQLAMGQVPGPRPLSAGLSVTPRAAPWSTIDFDAVLPAEADPRATIDTLMTTLMSSERMASARLRVAGVRDAARAERILAEDQIHYFVLNSSAYLLGSPEGSFLARIEALDALEAAQLDRAQATLQKGLAALRVAIAAPGAVPSQVAYRPPPPKAPSSAADARRASEILANGMDVSVERNDDSQVFAVHLLLRPRTASEPEEKEGIADFLHRLFLRGTIVHDRASLSALLDDMGAKVKTHDDARVPFDDYQTTSEFSFVRLELPVDRWREGIAVLGEIVRFPALDPGEVEAVRKEMLDLQKRRSESSMTVAQDATARLLAPNHPLSMPASGVHDSIASLSVDDLRAFHANYVTGKNSIVTVVGPVPPAEVIAAIRSALGALPPGAEPARPTSVPVTTTVRTSEQRVGKDPATLTIACVFTAPAQDEAALRVAGAILSDQLSFQLREEQGLAYSMSASCVPWGGRMKLETVMATRRENVDEALRGLEQGLAAFVAQEPDAATVERAANGIRGRLLMRRLTRINQAYFAGLERMQGRPEGDDLRRLAQILAVRPDDVKRVTRAHFDPSACARIVVR